MPLVAHISAFTHRGRVRMHNEDTIVVGDWLSPLEMEDPRSFRYPLSAPLVCAVADGLGGHSAGEVASRYAAERLAASAVRLTRVERVKEMLSRINDELYQAMDRDPSRAGMGTTLAGLVLSEHLVWFNVGDSRVYRFRDGRLTQVSVDDTPPGPRSGIITQCLGGVLPAAAVEPHIGGELLAAPARFLLCSDGLTDMLDDGHMADCLSLADVEAVMQLFDHAMCAGGGDNVSIVIVSVGFGDYVFD